MSREVNYVKLMCVGDIMLGERPMCLGHGIESMIRKKGPTFPFLKVADTLKKADIVFGNLISMLSVNGRNRSSFLSECIRGLPHYAEGLSSAGFNIISLANNHSMQHGKEALLECIQALRDYGIKTIGIVDQYGKSSPEIFRVKGIKIGFLGYLCMSQEFHLDTPMNADGEILAISKDITGLKAKGADIIIISLHWGDEFIECPSPEQVKLGRSIIEAGADIILGHHSHVIQGIEMYKGGLIAYCLGNLIMDFWQKKMREGIVLEISLSKEGIQSWKAVPIWINDHFQPEFLEGKKAEKILQRISYLSNVLKQKDLSNSIVKGDTYQQNVAKLQRKYRKEVFKYYLRHLLDYDTRMFLQNAMVIAKRRVLHKKI